MRSERTRDYTANHAAPDSYSRARLFARVSVPLFLIYLVTANWVTPYNIDALTNVLTANEIATDGDVYLEDHVALTNDEYRGIAAWVVNARTSAASQYPPGAPALAVPLYAIWPGEGSTETYIGAAGGTVDLPVPPLFPAALTSAAVGAIAAGLLGLVFREVVDSQLSLIAAYVAGLATGLWSVAADSLWQHGPGMMWIAAGLLLSASRPLLAGGAFGLAVLTRPHLALIAAGNGLWQSWQQRSLRPALLIGLGSVAGLAALVWYNAALFGTASISGGYSGSFGDRATSLDVIDYLGNIALALGHPTRGLLVYSPFLILLLPGIPAAWRAAPAWVRGSAVGGAAYLLLQLKANRYSGGEGFWGYRYPLEALVAAAPLLLLSYREWVLRQSHVVRRVFAYLLVLSIVLTATGALYFSSFWAGPSG